MKLALLASVMVLALASNAQAGGINLAWNECGTFGGSGALVANFACNTNSGSRTLYVSFAPPVNLDHLQSTDADIDILSYQPTLPPWWNLGDAGCRNTGFDNADFTAGPFDCVDPWAGQAVSAHAYTFMYNGEPTRARLHLVTTLAPNETSIPVDQEYYCVKFTISYTNTVGADACAGCLTPVCLFLQGMNLFQTPGNPSYQVTNPLNGQWVLFNGQSVHQCVPVPVRNNTWGSVKALYR